MSRASIHQSCISFDSYIKPQLMNTIEIVDYSCISFDSYIKPQPATRRANEANVVYLLIPTSNHNYSSICREYSMLYIF